MDVFASRGLYDALRSAPDDSIIPIRVIRRGDAGESVDGPPRVAAVEAAPETRPDVVVRFSARALRLASHTAETREAGDPGSRRPAASGPPPRGLRLDVVA